MPSPVPLAIMKTHSALSHLCVAVQAGARFDVGGRPGSNHLLEHLVFKAGARYPTRRAVDAALAAEGGEIDAATSLQFMTFYGSIPTAALPKLVDVLQDILFAPLRAAALDEETGIVAQEILDKANDPGNALWERGLAALFPGHPNDHREYGTAESVRRLTIEELSARKKALFVRENMAIGLASGLDDAAARSALRPLLDACPSGAAVRITPPPVAPTQPFVRFVPSSARQPILQLLIRGLPPNGPHLYALDVLVAVAGVLDLAPVPGRPGGASALLPDPHDARRVLERRLPPRRPRQHGTAAPAAGPPSDVRRAQGLGQQRHHRRGTGRRQEHLPRPNAAARRAAGPCLAVADATAALGASAAGRRGVHAAWPS